MSALPDPRTAALAALVVAAAGLLRGFAGFGAGLLMAPLLGLLLGPRLAVPVIVVLDALVAAPLLPRAWRQARWRDVLPAGAAAALTIPVGAAVLRSMDPAVLRRAIGAVVVVLVALLASGWRRRRRPGPLEAAGIGGVSGVLTGAGGIGGPPVILWLLAGDGSPTVQRASLIAYFAVTQAAALAVFAAAGLLDRRALVASAALAVPFLVCARLGALGFGRGGGRGFRAVALAALAIAGLAALLARGDGI